MKAAGCSWRVTTSSMEDLRIDFDDGEILLAGNTEDALDALVLERRDEKI